MSAQPDDPQAAGIEALKKTVPIWERLLANPDFQLFQKVFWMPEAEAQHAAALVLDKTPEDRTQAAIRFWALKEMSEKPFKLATEGRTKIREWDELQAAAKERKAKGETSALPPGLQE